MKKAPIIKVIALVLLVCMVSAVLCGCDIAINALKKVYSLIETEKTVYIEGVVTFYSEPDANSDVKAIFNDGYEIEYDETIKIGGVEWAETDLGWVAISGEGAESDKEQSAAEELPGEAVDPRTGFITARLLNVRSGPGVEYQQVTQVPKGTEVVVTRTAQASDGPWGYTEYGWLSLDHVYFPETEGETTGYAVVKESGAKIYDSILDRGSATGSISTGERVTVSEVVDIDGDVWAFAKGGWVSMKDLYMEGQIGSRECYGMVIDSTPLNVRVAPGTDNEILTTLVYGTYVHIYERINYNGNDWGYTGDGWVFMDLVEIHDGP